MNDRPHHVRRGVVPPISHVTSSSTFQLLEYRRWNCNVCGCLERTEGNYVQLGVEFPGGVAVVTRALPRPSLPRQCWRACRASSHGVRCADPRSHLLPMGCCTHR